MSSPGRASENLRLELPFDGELDASKEKKYAETVVLVHHFGGSKKTLARHAQLLNELGYDCVRFTLDFNQALPSKLLPITADLEFGARHLWRDQIESILNSVPGRKIVYSFSMPSNSALEALARRRAKDVAAWICDGGPFVELTRCIWNLYENEYKIDSRLLRGLYTGASLAFYGPGFASEVPALLAQLPSNFPIFSIRGRKDPLVPLSAIEGVFTQANQLNVETMIIEDGGHLDGLKSNPKNYSRAVDKFLKRVSTRL